jgi:hypothetical protein
MMRRDSSMFRGLLFFVVESFLVRLTLCLYMYVRDVVLGVNDGLVSMFLLQTGSWNAGLTNRQTLLFGVCGENFMLLIQKFSQCPMLSLLFFLALVSRSFTGAIAGAISMAIGELDWIQHSINSTYFNADTKCILLFQAILYPQSPKTRSSQQT